MGSLSALAKTLFNFWVLGIDLECPQILNVGVPDSLATHFGFSRDYCEKQRERLAASQCHVGSATKKGLSKGPRCL